MKRWRRTALLLCLWAALTAGITGLTQARFTSQTVNPGNSVTSAPDWVAPSAARSVVQKVEGGETGYLRWNGQFRVYGQITDSGNPSSGITNVNADLDPGGGFNVPMPNTPGPFAVDGLNYNYRSNVATVPWFTPQGNYAYLLNMTDGAGNARTQNGWLAVVDAARPNVVDVQTTNVGTAGRPNPGDIVTYTFSEPIDRQSIRAGWTSGSSTVNVQIANNAGGPARDRLTIPGTNLGEINLNDTDYVAATTIYSNSTMVRSTTNANQIVVTLGTATTPPAGTGNNAMAWTALNTIYDRAGNLLQTLAVNESGANDRDF